MNSIATSTRPKQILQSLQVFRGFGALAVVMHHAVISTDTFVSRVPDAVMSVLRLGYLGVDFFFVLSGFIIMHSHMQDERSSKSVRVYGLKRIVRIYPAYLPVTICVIFLYGLIPGYSASGARDFSLISSLLLVPADRPPALPVAWTLVHELLFYMVFLFYFVSARIFWIVLAAWVGAIVLANTSPAAEGWERYPLSILNIEFMFGVVSAWYLRSFSGHFSSRSFRTIGLLVAVTMLPLISTQDLRWLSLIFPFGLTLVVIGYIMEDRATNSRWPSALLVLGNASYSIYLIHNPLLSVTQRLAGKLEINWYGGLLLGVAMAVFGGLIYFRLVERPLTRLFRRVLKI